MTGMSTQKNLFCKLAQHGASAMRIVAVLMTGSTALLAGNITYEFGGHLLYVNDPAHDWNGAFTVNESFTGRLSYDSAIPFADCCGDYRGINALSISITFPGGYSFSNEPDTYGFITGATFQSFDAAVPSFWGGGTAVGRHLYLAFTGSSPTGGVPTSLGLPGRVSNDTDPLDMQIAFVDSTFHASQIIGTLTSLSAVAAETPEPSTLGTFALGAAVAGWMARRRR